MNAAVSRYPIDPELLQSGDVITGEEISQRTGLEVGTTDLQLRMLAIMGAANTHFVETGKPLLARITKGNVVIESGNQMVDTGEMRMRRALALIGRTTEAMSRVDRRELDDTHARVLDRTLYVGSRLMQGARVLQREAARGLPHRRTSDPPPWAIENGDGNKA